MVTILNRELYDRKTFYNYAYLDPTKPGKFTLVGYNITLLYEPFYIGKGKRFRCFRHINEKGDSEKIKYISHLKNIGYSYKDIRSFIVQFNFSEDEENCKDLEKSLIKEVGRKYLELGPLLNIGAGGEGYGLDGPANPMYGNFGPLNPFYGKKHTPESIKLMREYRLGTKASPELKKHFSDTRQGSDNNFYGEKHTPESIKLMSTARKKYLRENQHPNGNHIQIFNSDDTLVYESFGNLKEICKNNKLPFNSITKSYKNKTKITKETLHNLYKKYHSFIGWYAVDKGKNQRQES